MDFRQICDGFWQIYIKFEGLSMPPRDTKCNIQVLVLFSFSPYANFLQNLVPWLVRGAYSLGTLSVLAIIWAQDGVRESETSDYGLDV